MTKRRAISWGQGDVARWGKRSRSSDGGDLDITPMIDVTFLLLIFFMVSSTMSRERELDVPEARNGVNITSETSIVLIVLSPRSRNDQPILQFEGREIELTEIEALIKEENQKGKTQVVIRAGRNVPHGFVQRVIREANTIDELDFSFGVEDKTGS